MKNYKRYLNLFIPFLAICILFISCQEELKVVKIEYEKSIGPITLEDKVVTSYLVNNNKNLSDQNILGTAKMLAEISELPLNNNRLIEIDGGVLALKNEKDPSASFEMDKHTGKFLYNGGLAEYKKDNNTPELPKGEMAESMAVNYLKKLEVLPLKEELTLASVGGLNMAVVNEDKTTEIFKKLVTVRYSRKLADVPVMGDSRIIVNMGSKGKLAGLIYYWGEVLEKIKMNREDLLSDKDIKKELESKLRLASSGAKKILVQKAEFVLYDDGRKLIEPAFHVEARLYYDEANSKEEDKMGKYDIPYDYYIPVLKNPRAFYPFMETAKVMPTDAPETEVISGEDE